MFNRNSQTIEIFPSIYKYNSHFRSKVDRTLQDGRYACNVTLRLVRVVTVAEEKQ